MKLKPLTREDCETARGWRNECLETLRTPYFLTKEMQSEFYDNVICNRNSSHRYWSLHQDLSGIEKTADWCGAKSLVGIGGITDIEWENSIGEISLIIDSRLRGIGFGDIIVGLLLNRAFNQMGLKTVCGECYYSNGAGIAFWRKIVEKYKGYSTTLPDRKFWAGKYHNSMYFSIHREEFNKVKNGN